MKYKSINFIANHLNDIIEKESCILIDNLSSDYNLENEYLKKNYLETDIIKNNIKTHLNSKIRCMGIIKSGTQCARTRKNNSEFCLIHQKSLKFGKIHN